MDLEPDDLQHLGPSSILANSVAIARSSPAHFFSLTLVFILPFSISFLAYSSLTLHLISHLYLHPYSLSYPLLFAFYQALSLFFLLSLSLLSTGTVVYSVACVYTTKFISFSHLLAAVPRLLRPLLVTFPGVLLRAVTLCTCLMVELALFISLLQDPESHHFLPILILSTTAVFLSATGLYFSAEWRLSCIVSVLEEVRGREVIRKSRGLLKGKVVLGCFFALVELVASGGIGIAFAATAVNRAAGLGFGARLVLGILLAGILLLVNLVGLLVQSVFYHVCKAFHHEGIDKSSLYEHLDGYLGESVPLSSSVELGNI
ncbi:unnamed protein product [Victoria cruziana]